MKIRALCVGKLNIHPRELRFKLLCEEDKKCGEMYIEADFETFNQFEVGKEYEFATPPLRHEMAILKHPDK